MPDLTCGLNYYSMHRDAEKARIDGLLQQYGETGEIAVFGKNNPIQAGLHLPYTAFHNMLKDPEYQRECLGIENN